MTEAANTGKGLKKTSLTMQTPIHQNNPANHDEIASIAFILWDQAGQPSGRDLEFWLSAEQRIAAHQTQSKAPAPAGMNSLVEQIEATRLSSTGTNPPHQTNGANPKAKPADRPTQARAKRAAFSIT